VAVFPVLKLACVMTGTGLLTAKIAGDDGGLRASLVAFAPSMAGTYYVKVHDYSASTFGATNSYTLALATRSACNEREPDDSKAAASTLDSTMPQAHALCIANDVDWVKFDAQAGTLYTIKAFALARPQTATALELWDATGVAPLQQVAPGADGSATIAFTPTVAGTYYLAVSQFNGAGGTNYTYMLSIDP
jgi:hypothetical protein